MSFVLDAILCTKSLLLTCKLLVRLADVHVVVYLDTKEVETSQAARDLLPVVDAGVADSGGVAHDDDTLVHPIAPCSTHLLEAVVKVSFVDIGLGHDVAFLSGDGGKDTEGGMLEDRQEGVTAVSSLDLAVSHANMACFEHLDRTINVLLANVDKFYMKKPNAGRERQTLKTLYLSQREVHLLFSASV